MTIRRTMALLLALAGCGEVSTPGHDPECFEGDGGVCSDQAASARSELSLGSIGGGIRPVVRVRPGIQLDVVSRCRRGAVDTTNPSERWRIGYHATGVVPLSSAQLCREGECIWSATFPDRTFEDFGSVVDPTIRVFTPSDPLPRVTYTGRVTDINRGYASIDRSVRVGPPTELEITGLVRVVDGPRTGDGVRHIEVPWRGLNVGRVCLRFDSDFEGVPFGTQDEVCEVIPSSQVWGPIERTTTFSTLLTAEAADFIAERERTGGRGPLVVEAESEWIDGCAGSAQVHRYPVWSPPRTAVASLSPASDSPRPVWMPECRWTCESTSSAGWIRTSTRSSSTCASGRQHEVCRHDDREAGELLSVCASEPIPSGWDDLGVRESEARCGGGPAPVRLIQRGH